MNKLKIEYVKPEKLILNERNPRIHPDSLIEKLIGSMREYGWTNPILVNKDNVIIAGHARLKAALQSKIKEVPVIYLDLDEDKAMAYMVADNRLQDESTWDIAQLEKIIEELKLNDIDYLMMGFDEGELEDLVQRLNSELSGAEMETLLEDQKQAIKESKDDIRIHRVDIIWTASGGRSCCIATSVGWLYGFQSGKEPCPLHNRMKNHYVAFIDNDFKNYNHRLHLEYIKKFKPKYATVRDIMTKEQCQKIGIQWYSLEEIFHFAEEIGQYAENVILIPKYDCIKDIPEKYMLGYSVPTSYGRTELPLEKFKNRRVHLLGGSPNKQIMIWNQLKEEVVSLDNNYLMKTSKYGNIWLQNGTTIELSELLAEQYMQPFYPTLAINLANFAGYFGKEAPEEIVCGEKYGREEI